MQGYTSVSFICDEKNYWNQEATTIAYGFDRLYAGMEGDRERKYADENLFKTSLSTMQKMKTPFMHNWLLYPVMSHIWSLAYLILH